MSGHGSCLTPAPSKSSSVPLLHNHPDRWCDNESDQKETLYVLPPLPFAGLLYNTCHSVGKKIPPESFAWEHNKRQFHPFLSFSAIDDTLSTSGKRGKKERAPPRLPLPLLFFKAFAWLWTKIPAMGLTGFGYICEMIKIRPFIETTSFIRFHFRKITVNSIFQTGDTMYNTIQEGGRCHEKTKNRQRLL